MKLLFKIIALIKDILSLVSLASEVRKAEEVKENKDAKIVEIKKNYSDINSSDTLNSIELPKDS